MASVGVFCGGGGIRTPETVAGLTVFETAPFVRSGTPPYPDDTDFLAKWAREVSMTVSLGHVKA